jgi:small conductance mechanosensitive channel
LPPILVLAAGTAALGQERADEGPPTSAAESRETRGSAEGEAAPATHQAVSEAERIADLKRAIDAADARLKQIAAQIEDPRSEYAQAEEEFQALEQKLDDLRKALKAAGPSPPARLADELAIAEKNRRLAKDRFDLAIDERRALQEQSRTIEAKRSQDQAALDRLMGIKPPAPPANSSEPGATPSATAAGAPDAAAPPSTPSAPAAPEPAAPPATGLPVGAPAATAPGAASASAAPAAPGEPPSRELIEARKEVEAKEESAREAEEEAKSVGERLAALDKSIELEKTLLETDRKKADNAEQTRAALSGELQQLSVDGAPEAERRAMARKVREAEARAVEAHRDAREHSDRLDGLQSERAELLALQVEAARAAASAKEEAERAEAKVARLENPFAPLNLLRWVIDHGPRLLAILVAMVVSHWVSRQFTRRVVKIMAQSGSRGSREEREARANTLVGVFHNAASVAVYIGGTLMVLQEVGIPIAPLLGGAAIFGLAVAFGAQNLIRDYFYGFVILLENQYKLNDVVKIGEHSGQVERITLRMTVLRDLEGNVHFLPNGEITSVTNMTHGWSRAVFDIQVAYREDVDRVIAVVEGLGRELRNDPAWRLMILEDLEMLGVDALGDSAVVLKFLIKTRTLKQWTVKREMLRRIKNKFDELGIEIPFPQRTVHHRVEGQGRTVAEEAGRVTLRGHHGRGA